MRIVIVNQPLGNRGDESAHKGLVRALLKNIPKIDITVLFVGVSQDSINQFAIKSPQVTYINLLNRESSNKLIASCSLFGFLYSRWKKWLYRCFYKAALYPLQTGDYSVWNTQPVIQKIKHYYTESDLILCAPGGICMGGFQNWYHLFYLKLAQHMNKPVAYYGRSFGPFQTKTELNCKFKKLSLELLHYFTFISIRDKKTEALAQELAINYVPTLDSAFLDTPQTTISSEVKKILGETPYMVFVPNLLTWHYAYKSISKETIISFYNQLIDCIIERFPDYHIVMLPQTFNSASSNDILLFKEIANIRQDKRIIVMPDSYSSDIQQAIIHQAKFVVGARYHSIVFAINQAVPFIALSYEHKIEGLLQALGKVDCMVNISHIFEKEADKETAVLLFKDLLLNLKSDVQAQTNAKQKADACFQLFIKKFL